MELKETQYTMCAKAIDENKFIPLTIGLKHYESLDMLQSDFGDDVTVPIQKKLCKYFAQGIPFQGIQDKKDRDDITKFLQKRIKLLENNGQLATNASFAGSAKMKAIAQLNKIIETLGEPDKTTTATTATTATAITKKIRRATLLEQLWIAMYKVANLEENEIDVDANMDNLLEAIDNIAPDEALRDAANLTRAKGKAKVKTAANSLEKYITNGATSSSTESTDMDVTMDNKTNLVKLLVLFKTTKWLKEAKLAEDIDTTFTDLSKSIPMIVDNIFFYNRSIMRFFRSRYLEITEVFNAFFNKDNGRITDLRRYPIDLMIRIIYILFNLARFINRDAFSIKYSPFPFPMNQGLLRFTLSQESTNIYSQQMLYLTNLIDLYENFINDQLSTKLTDKNSLTPPLNMNSLDYQLIHLHKSSRVVPIIQLINGKRIDINEEILNKRIEKLQATANESNKLKYTTLSNQIKTFFQNKDTAIFIIYQQSPNNLISSTGKNTEILQLNKLQCIMANITDDFLDAKEQGTAPRSIEMKKEAKLPRAVEDKATDILPSLTTKNTFEDFGITVKTPLPLTCSITQMTGSILNATYLNKRLKRLKGVKDN